MPCDKFMELPLEDRVDWNCLDGSDLRTEDIDYLVRVNPHTQEVEYQFSLGSAWVPAREILREILG